MDCINGTRLVENPKADAIRATADTGSSEPSGRTHDYDEVIVALGDAEFSLTIDGKARVEERRQARRLRDRCDQVITS